ncbi:MULTISPECIES: ATP-dependent DNA helicase [Arthrobacter]|uniref:DNA 5'-3' helicase n=2 Tax=Arthrobacter TaxID=1663 RepID=A0ABU9KR56_9MICC|nr:ATP-dependent DNA helicase [Arthrobacter sp. YJM1]MDP5227863.1 ATP-dependent DNA helicase [Arthrobacter sp. YJM1]
MSETSTAGRPEDQEPGEDSPAVRRALALLDTAVSAMGGQSRTGQHQMVSRVASALDEQRHLLVQAGTGTGKSLGYLVPVIDDAVRNGNRAIISTATLALQAQIMGRDLPRLLKALDPELPRPVKTALVKGRSNYLCMHKVGGGFPEEDPAEDQLFGVGADGALFSSSTGPGLGSGPGTQLGREILRLRDWAQETDTGDRDDLTPGVSERAWRQVSVTALECIGPAKCPMAEECFSERARAVAAESDVIVTNHAMLAINAFEGVAVLPEYDVVVVDEAHELQDRVTGAVTGQLSEAMVTAAARAARRHAHIDIGALESAARGLEDALAPLPTGLLARGIDEPLGLAIDAVREACRAALSDSKPDQGQPADGALQAARSRLTQLLEVSERLLVVGERQEVVWLTRTGTFEPGAGYRPADDDAPATVTVAPLSVAMKLRDGLFDGHTAILTSATLAIGAAFDQAAGDVGLKGPGAPDWEGVDVGSPFDYPRQGMLYVARHLPKPGRGIGAEALQEVVDLIKASGGGALGLFSSRRAAEEAADYVREHVDVPVLCQGEATMSSLIKDFAEDRDACLFGTLTLWQGVDVPGDSCRLVIMDRIPFPRPDDPLNTARSRAVAQNGGNGFMAISASSAAIKMAQGAGRLIRATGDKGVVAVLDSRLATERYGGFIRSTLPPFWATTDRQVVLEALGRLAVPQKA